MDVTVEVVGEGTETVAVDADATYADLVRAVGYSVHEVTVLVDGAPVPEDQPVASDRVRVLRLIKGGGGATPTGVSVRRGDPAELVAVVRVLEGALLDVDVDSVREALAAGRVYVAVDGPASAAGDGSAAGDSSGTARIVGALYHEGGHVEAVAVPRHRRGEGIGRALVEAAGADVAAAGDPLTADFGADVRGFYEALGFEIESGDGRLHGAWTPDA